MTRRPDQSRHLKSRQHKHKMAETTENISCDLPEEIWFQTISYLEDVQDILNLGCTCRRLYDVTNQNIIWRRRFKADNSHLLYLPRTSTVNRVTVTSNYINSVNTEVLDVEPGVWKRLYLKASHALSFGHRHYKGFSSLAGERLCAEFVTNPSASNGIRFDDRAPVKQSVEVWVKLNKRKPDGIIIGCQSESVRYLAFIYHAINCVFFVNNCQRKQLHMQVFISLTPLSPECLYNTYNTCSSLYH